MGERSTGYPYGMSPTPDHHDRAPHRDPDVTGADEPVDGGPGGGDVDPMRRADAANGEPAATED